MYGSTKKKKKKIHKATVAIYYILKSVTEIRLEILGVYSMISDCGRVDRNMLDR